MVTLTTITLGVVLISQAYSAPQFINFGKDGKLGVNFGGYHAAVGLGGLLGQNGGAGGGLFAEAGTPHGQAAKAGLGGAVDNGGSAGGLFAGATAGGNVKAETGLAGGTLGDKSAGAGFASAQAGNHYASSGLGGDTSNTGASGFTFSGTKSFGVSNGKIDSSVLDVKPIQAEHKKVHKEFNFDAANDVNFTPLSTGFQRDVTVRTENRPQVIVKEEEVSNNHVPKVYPNRGSYSNDNYLSFLFRVPPVNYRNRVSWTPYYPSFYKNSQVYIQSPPRVVEKHIIHKHTKPRHHFRTTIFGGLNGGNDGFQTISQPAIQKRIDVGLDAGANAGAVADTGINGNLGHTYTKQVTFQRNPNFFSDIFNIPISTLKAVGNFLGNTAGSTSVSVQKSGSVQADSDLITPKHAAASSVSSSDAHISIQTPNVSKVIDDILAIPINTLGAVNKFLENNVPARKTVQASEDGSVEHVRRLGPHARRRANKQVVIVQEENVQKTESEKSS